MQGIVNTKPVDINEILDRVEYGCLINGRPVLLIGKQLIIVPLDKLPEVTDLVIAYIVNRPQWKGK